MHTLPSWYLYQLRRQQHVRGVPDWDIHFEYGIERVPQLPRWPLLIRHGRFVVHSVCAGIFPAQYWPGFMHAVPPRDFQCQAWCFGLRSVPRGIYSNQQDLHRLPCGPIRQVWRYRLLRLSRQYVFGEEWIVPLHGLPDQHRDARPGRHSVQLNDEQPLLPPQQWPVGRSTVPQQQHDQRLQQLCTVHAGGPGRAIPSAVPVYPPALAHDDPTPPIQETELPSHHQRSHRRAHWQRRAVSHAEASPQA